MVNYTVTTSKVAKADLKNIATYITYEFLAPATAIKQINRIQKTVDSLSFMPERYKIYDAFPVHENIRIVSVDNYCIIYHVNTEAATVTILRVVYGKCDMDTLDIDIHWGENRNDNT